LFTQLVMSVGLAIIISALCSIAEAVLYSVPASHVEVLASSGRLPGRLLRRLKKDIQRPIVAILTLNTIANTVGAAMAGVSAAAVFGPEYLPLFSGLFTLAILLFSEILPKTIGVTYHRGIATWVAMPIYGLVKILAPLIWLCRMITRLIPGPGKEHMVSAEEIQAIATLGRKVGEIDPHQERVIYNILELENKRVRQVMTPRPVTFALNENLTVAEAIGYREKWDLHSRVPVYDENLDDIVGMVLRKDVLIYAAEDKGQTKISTLMHQVHFVPESAPLNKVFLDFIERRLHLFVVVDEYGSFTGVITMEDIIEEIVGQEIMDETDKTIDMRQLARQRRRQVARHATIKEPSTESRQDS